MKKQGVLLLNLGSPQSPAWRDVARYLGEFLMDERVMDMPYLARMLVVYGCILPFRVKHSAAAYGKIWLRDGSPLVVTGRRVKGRLQSRMTIPVELAMRYQSPSVKEAVLRLLKKGVHELLLIPMFPHYAMSSYETAVEHVKRVLAVLAPQASLRIVSPYHDDPDYIEALAASAADGLSQDYDHLLFSFHGLPERHLRKSDPTGGHCLAVENCCAGESPVHRTCYRAQCLKTVRAFIQRTGVPEGKCSIAFQSRLGRDRWLTPYTEERLARLPSQGVKKLLVLCPSFVSDCLETLEEIGMRGKETFLQAGGEAFRLIPCLNDHPLWIDALEKMIARSLEFSAPRCDPAAGVA